MGPLPFQSAESAEKPPVVVWPVPPKLDRQALTDIDVSQFLARCWPVPEEHQT